MLKLRYKSLLTLIAVSVLCTCIDPYSQKLKGYESILVVDGLITDENLSYSVKISKTFQDQNATPEKVSDAIVFITDNLNNITYLEKHNNGLYKTDSLLFRGVIGNSYTLHITTREGTEYESDRCTMESVQEIDNVYFSKDQDLLNNGTESQDGVRIWLDSKSGDFKQYFRWAFEEAWKFKVPNPRKYEFYSSGNIVPIRDIKQYCWKTRKSDEIIISRAYSGAIDRTEKQPIFFIAPAKSDRLMIEYSILVKQYSISKAEYEFWDNLKKVNESGADIFASQPFPVVSNIHNINNSKEKVLGFFQVSAEKQKRIFIPFSEFVRMQLPFYQDVQCKRFEKAPSEYATELGSAVTFEMLYAMFCIDSDYYFIEPKYSDETGILEKLVFARPECADCELTGTSVKPDFWVDLN